MPVDRILHGHCCANPNLRRTYFKLSSLSQTVRNYGTLLSEQAVILHKFELATCEHKSTLLQLQQPTLGDNYCEKEEGQIPEERGNRKGSPNTIVFVTAPKRSATDAQ
jgi:hypothetical protein